MYLPKYFWIIQQDEDCAQEAEELERLLDYFMENQNDEFGRELIEYLGLRKEA